MDEQGSSVWTPPRELRERLLAKVRQALAGELGALASDHGLGHDELVREAEASAADLLLVVEVEWQQLVEARSGDPSGSSPTEAGDAPARLPRLLVERLRETPFIVAAVVATGLAAFFVANGPSLAASPWAVGLAAVGLLAIFSWGTLIGEGSEARVRAERVASAEERLDAAIEEKCVNGWLTLRINLEVQPSFATSFGYRGTPRFAEVDDPRHEIPTGSREELGEMLKRMPGGAIGISGPRGAGKSTLVRSACSVSHNEAGKPVYSVMVEAPVEYEPRDFVLHLFAEVCSKVVGAERVTQLRGWNRPFGDGSGLLAQLRRRPYLLAGPVLAVAGLALWRLEQLGSIAIERGAAGFTMWVLGAVLTAATVGVEAPRIRRGIRDWLALRRSPHARGNVETAMVRLRQIWFQQTYSSGWSGAFKLPVGSVEGKFSAQADLSDRQMSYPDVVGLFREFLEQVAGGHEVRIGIDELDKMGDEAAHRFLNGIKAVFRIPGCFFFISVSEDAMSSFDRRGVPFRDVFDSSFDDVLEVGHLGLASSLLLVERRVVGLPVPFVGVLHVFSGGLPRDLIRVARDLFAQERGASLEGAVAELGKKLLTERIAATYVVARRLEAEYERSLLSAWLESIREAGADPARLIDRCARLEREFLLPLGAGGGEDLREERREVRRLGLQMAVGAYLVATTLELFGSFSDSDFARAAMDTEDDAAPPPVVERLGEAARTFSADLELAWRKVSEVRFRADLEPVLEFPPPLRAGGEDGQPPTGAVAGLPS